MRDGLLTLACPHGTTAHGLSLPVEADVFLAWLRHQPAVHRGQLGCRCRAGAMRVGGGA